MRALWYFALLVMVASARPIVIGCVGDSITEGKYPGDLQDLLGKDYKVYNWGKSGTTLQHAGDYPYWNSTEFRESMNTTADYFVIQLGTNDAKTWNWNQDRYTNDYNELINLYVTRPNKPKVFINIPPPLYKDGVYGMQQSVINTVFPELIPQIAADHGLPTIDIFNYMGGAALTQPDLFADGCHPTPEGYLHLAAAVREAITNN
ncbi:putative sialate O-acetylesterase [Paratrimastix pyriformis]|uniref:Sialate O-acetylesterase n=1 Tax=Paratrimastix pyriformis TaxID=342808 RepID=A0ABQ8UI18_9EUKA|nr:putative sialate O-acetylesterase [Paratrimastix pyriformis]